ncbi:MAG TPA: hypothetical protein VFU46_02325 [Gemmatimonadales bacterium]|nr:hypothetical protein [Gemmatimonadales bacterium]
MQAAWAAAWRRDAGQALIEYALIMALVAAGLIGVLLMLREEVGGSYGRLSDRIDAAGSTTRSGSLPGGGTGGATPGGSGGGGYGGHGCGGGHGGGLGRGGGGGCGGGGNQ